MFVPSCMVGNLQTGIFITNTLQTPSHHRYIPQCQGAEIRREL